MSMFVRYSYACRFIRCIRCIVRIYRHCYRCQRYLRVIVNMTSSAICMTGVVVDHQQGCVRKWLDTCRSSRILLIIEVRWLATHYIYQVNNNNDNPTEIDEHVCHFGEYVCYLLYGFHKDRRVHVDCAIFQLGHMRIEHDQFNWCWT
jgi:hypothetical protein